MSEGRAREPDRAARRRRRATPRDYGRIVARLLCGLFALIGLLPLAAGFVARSEAVRARVAAETASLLRDQLGLAASYRVEVELWPLSVALRDLDVPASDGGSSAFSAARVAVAPSVLALFSGRLDAGDIEIDRPAGRIVIQDGRLANVAYRLPARDPAAPSAPLTRSPFSSLAIGEGRFDVLVEGVHIVTGPIDLDVFAEPGLAFEVALRQGETRISRTRTVARSKAAPEHTVTDDDVVCRLEARARWQPGSLLVRRLGVRGVADADAAPDTFPTCPRAGDADENAVQRVAVRLSQVRVTPREGELPLVDGHVVVRAPASLTNRFVAMAPLSGWVALSGDVRFDGASRLPDVRARVRAKGFHLGGYRLGESVDGQIWLHDETIEGERVTVNIADGDAVVQGLVIRPFEKGVPISVRRVDGDGQTFPGLMRDLDVTPNTIVGWDLDDLHVTHFGGTVSPVALEGDLVAGTKAFAVYDRAWHSPARRRMVGVERAAIKGKIRVTPGSFDIFDTRADFGSSAMLVRLVSIGFDNDLDIRVEPESKLNLADISPLVDLPISGVARLGVELHGKARDPLLTGDASVEALSIAGFSIGDVKSTKVRFRPLKVDFLDARGRKGQSDFQVPSARLEFDTDASVRADAIVKSDKMDVRDFFAMWHFDTDPRFDPIAGSGKIDARVHYQLGGRADRCGGGLLDVEGSATFGALELFEEKYDSGSATFDFNWFDRDASYLGMSVDVPSVRLTKGGGTLLGSATISPGAVIRGHVVGSSLPLSAFQSLDPLGKMVSGSASAVAEVSGTIDALEVDSHVHVSAVRFGKTRLPPSELAVSLTPTTRPRSVLGRTRCGAPVTPQFNRGEWEADRADGVFHTTGQLFGGQVRLDDLQVTRQRKKHATGDIVLERLDLGALAELAPDDGRPPKAQLSAVIHLDDLPMAEWTRTRASARLTALDVDRAGTRLALEPGSAGAQLADGRLDLPRLGFAFRSASGATGAFDVKARLGGLGADPDLDASVELRPTDLGALLGFVPGVEHATGSVRGRLRASGKARAPAWDGELAIEGGEVALTGLGLPVRDVNVRVLVDSGELRLERASARLGAGRVELAGSAPLVDGSLGAARATIRARDLALPTTSGVKATIDSDLDVAWTPPRGDERSLPRVTGEVSFRQFEYSRPIAMSVDLDTLAQRGKRSKVEAYDPAEDSVAFDVTLRSPRPLAIRNNLVEADLEIDGEGVTVSGTNQRFGARGIVRLKPGGHIRLRQSDFEITQGTVRLDDASRIAPEVDVTAVTEYRRYSTSGDVTTRSSSASTTGAASTSATSATGGRWMISLRAHGDAENLRVDLTSNPALAQDDIFLLLTVGLTRAELDQAQSASVGGSVALEALGTLSGADRAVTEAVPLIDEFRFGSAYSSRTGRTEPTVTVGKRLTSRVRANVTSGFSESREVRSNLEIRLSPRVSVEGSYDNVNDLSSQLGNLGANLRWRLEFE